MVLGFWQSVSWWLEPIHGGWVPSPLLFTLPLESVDAEAEAACDLSRLSYPLKGLGKSLPPLDQNCWHESPRF